MTINYVGEIKLIFGLEIKKKKKMQKTKAFKLNTKKKHLHMINTHYKWIWVHSIIFNQIIQLPQDSPLTL